MGCHYGTRWCADTTDTEHECSDQPAVTRCPDYGHLMEDGADGCQECVEMKREAWADSVLDRARGR